VPLVRHLLAAASLAAAVAVFSISRLAYTCCPALSRGKHMPMQE
jgi:hypothetical protein